VKCPVCHAELELMLKESDVEEIAAANREAWAKVEEQALLREANGPDLA
jgi:hypothetical protein